MSLRVLLADPTGRKLTLAWIALLGLLTVNSLHASPTRLLACLGSYDAFYRSIGDAEDRHYCEVANLILGYPADLEFLRERLGSLELRPGTGPRIPYRDLPVEYPPATLPLMLLPRLLTGHLAGYCTVFGGLMAWLAVAGVSLAVRLAPDLDEARRLMAFTLGATVVLNHLVTSRLDMAVSLSLVAALAA
ncbi:MAG: hypothetical protein AB1758_21745, partial [Candidatus Eremiobacterota bacterium]